MLAPLVPAAPASADNASVYIATRYKAVPRAFFSINNADTSNSTISFYTSVSSYFYGTTTWNRYRVTSRAGSGTGTTDQCSVGNGPLPKGTYGPAYSGTNFKHENRTGWNTAVEGHVWFLDTKDCGGWNSQGGIRNELFVHGSGDNWDAHTGYYSNGCIKLHNTARRTTYHYWRLAWGTNSTSSSKYLRVY